MLKLKIKSDTTAGKNNLMVGDVWQVAVYLHIL